MIQLSIPIQITSKDQHHRSRGREFLWSSDISDTYVARPQVGSAVHRTDLNGDVTVTTDGTTYDIKTGQASSPPASGSAKTVTTQQAVSSQSSTGAVCECRVSDGCGSCGGITCDG